MEGESNERRTRAGKKIEFERENGGAIEVEDDDYDDDDAIRVCR